MIDSPDDPDRLRVKKAIWTQDPDVNLTAAELDKILGKFEVTNSASNPELREAVSSVFRLFYTRATEERVLARDGKVKKATTVAQEEMGQLLKAFAKFEEQLAELGPSSRAWIDTHLRETGIKKENGRRVRLQDLEKGIIPTANLGRAVMAYFNRANVNFCGQ